MTKLDEFGIFYVYLVYFMAILAMFGPLVEFPTFCYILRRKIWQPRYRYVCRVAAFLKALGSTRVNLRAPDRSSGPLWSWRCPTSCRRSPPWSWSTWGQWYGLKRIRQHRRFVLQMLLFMTKYDPNIDFPENAIFPPKIVENRNILPLIGNIYLMYKLI
jgi:hypothetical protein